MMYLHGQLFQSCRYNAKGCVPRWSGSCHTSGAWARSRMGCQSSDCGPPWRSGGDVVWAACCLCLSNGCRIGWDRTSPCSSVVIGPVRYRSPGRDVFFTYASHRWLWEVFGSVSVLLSQNHAPSQNLYICFIFQIKTNLRQLVMGHVQHDCLRGQGGEPVEDKQKFYFLQKLCIWIVKRKHTRLWK